MSPRSYTPLKLLGNGAFGTIWLCDWHTLLPPDTTLGPIQYVPGVYREWAGKRLVAVKRLAKRFNDGWKECQNLNELKVSHNWMNV